MRSSCFRSVPTMRQFWTGNSLSDSVSTSFWASSYLSNVPSDIGYSRFSRARTWLKPLGCVLIARLSQTRSGGSGRGHPRAAYSSRSRRPMIIRWMSAVPSPMSNMGASR